MHGASYFSNCILTRSAPSHERMLASFNTNLFGAVNLTRSVLPHFREKKSGTVVFMGSIGGWQGEVGAGPYCATKFAMEGLQPLFQFRPHFSNHLPHLRRDRMSQKRNFCVWNPLTNFRTRVLPHKSLRRKQLEIRAITLSFERL